MFKTLLQQKTIRVKALINDQLLAKQLPEFVKNILTSKSILIPKILLLDNIQRQLASIPEIESSFAVFTESGIEIAIIYKKYWLTTNVNFVVKIERIELNSRQKIYFSISGLRLTASGLIEKITLALVSSFIESLIDQKLSDLSTDEINMSKENEVFICDVSEVRKLKAVNKNIPIINRSVLEILQIEKITHQENGILLRCSADYVLHKRAISSED